MLGKKGRGSNQYIKAKSLGLVAIQSEKAKYFLANWNRGRVWSPERRKEMSVIAKKKGLGGHNSKQRLQFLKKDGSSVYLQSSYEIRFAQILEDLNIPWERPARLEWLDDQGVDHYYYPDFKVGNIYIDTKNDYLAIKDLPKIEAVRKQNNIDLRIVTNTQINEDFIKSLVFLNG